MTVPRCAFGHPHGDAVARWVHPSSSHRTPLCAPHLRLWLSMAAERHGARPVTLEPLPDPTRPGLNDEHEEDDVNSRGKLPPVEPGAEQRQAALQLRSLYVALVESGFSERQALTLIAQVFNNGVAQAQPPDEPA